MRSASWWRDVLPELWQDRGFALYVHWPFCAAKCPYCDFNSHVRKEIDLSAWADALAGEIRRVSKGIEGRVLTSVFFGGGTPSLMSPDTVKSVLDAARDVWVFANDIEITLEANPTSVDASRFEGYAKHGVNRVSLGIQAMNDDDLSRLGRLHSVTEAKDAFALARSVFPRVSFDVIYARQNQTLQAWQDELEEILALAADHLSLYQLTIEKGTAFGDLMARGRLRGLPDDDVAADMFDLTQELCATAGFSAYEVSNHAKQDSESRHNLIYWRGGDYAGVGAGAHGRITRDGVRYASEAWKQPEIWLKQVQMGSGDKLVEPLSPQDVAYERMIMGLRLTEGLELDDVSNLLNRSAVEDLQDLGLIWISDGLMGATQKGRVVLNSVISELVKD